MQQRIRHINNRLYLSKYGRNHNKTQHTFIAIMKLFKKIILPIFFYGCFSASVAQTSITDKQFPDKVNHILSLDRQRRPDYFKADTALASIQIYEEALKLELPKELRCELYYYIASNCYELAANMFKTHADLYKKAIKYYSKYREQCIDPEDTVTLDAYNDLIKKIQLQQSAYDDWQKIKDSKNYSTLIDFICKHQYAEAICHDLLDSDNFKVAEAKYQKDNIAIDRFHIMGQYEIPIGSEDLTPTHGVQAAMLYQGFSNTGWYYTFRANKGFFNFTNSIENLNTNILPNPQGNRKSLLALSTGIIKNIYKPFYLTAGVSVYRQRTLQNQIVSQDKYNKNIWIFDKNDDRFYFGPEAGLIIAGRVISFNMGIRFYNEVGQNKINLNMKNYSLYCGLGFGLKRIVPKQYYIMYNQYYHFPELNWLSIDNQLLGITLGAIDGFYITAALNRSFLYKHIRELSSVNTGYLLTSIGYNIRFRNICWSLGGGLLQKIDGENNQSLRFCPETGLGLVFHRLMFRFNVNTTELKNFSFNKQKLILSVGIGFNFN